MAAVPQQFVGKNWQPGQSGNPAGRPRGSKNKKELTEAFLSDLAETWSRRGMQALEEVATTKPVDFVKVCASLIPKEALVTITDDSTAYVINAAPNLSIDEWQARHQLTAQATESSSNGAGQGEPDTVPPVADQG